MPMCCALPERGRIETAVADLARAFASDVGDTRSKAVVGELLTVAQAWLANFTTCPVSVDGHPPCYDRTGHAALVVPVTDR